MTAAISRSSRFSRPFSRPLSRALVVMLYATIGLFYAGVVYDSDLASRLFYAKWIPLFGVLFLAGKYAFWAQARQRFAPYAIIIFIALVAFSLNIAVSIAVGRSMFIYISVTVLIITSFFLASILDEPAARQKLFEIIANVGRLVILSSFVMLMLGLSFGRGTHGRFDAWTDNPNSLALLLVPALVILLAGVIERRPGWVWRDTAFLLPGLIVLIQTGSRSSLLWFAVSSFAFWVARRGAGVSFYVGMLALIILFGWWDEIAGFVIQRAMHEGTENDADVLSGRSEMWALALELSAKNLFLGYGLGTSGLLIEEHGWFFREAQGHHFHNSYLTILVETGVVGFVAFLMLVLPAMMRGLSANSRLRQLHGKGWPTAALPWVLLMGALAHGTFETWLLSAGNANGLLFWTLVWMLWRRSAVHRPVPHRIDPAAQIDRSSFRMQRR